MLYAVPSFNHLGALDICVVHWDLIPLERNPVNTLIIDVHDAISRQSADIWGCLKAIGLGQLLVLRKRHRHTRAGRTCLDFVLNTV